MEKILFSHSYFMRFDPKQWATGQPYPPLATIGAAALMREHGYQVSLFDTMFVDDPDEVIKRLAAERPDFFVVYDDGFNYLTKMCLTNMRDAAHRMIRMARQYGCTIILSSSDSTDHYGEYLQKGADFVLLGEGEQSLLELVNAIRDGQQDLSAIRGLAYTKDGVPLKTAARPVMRDLDTLPLPAWDLVDIPAYRAIHMEHHGYFSLNVSTTRGCPFKCNWCAKPIYGNRYNARSPHHVVKELKWLKHQYDFDHIWFCDDIFGLKPGWVNEFADLVERTGLHFRFKIQSRADLLLQENYVAALARAGCDNSWMGAESGSQKILDAMDKGTTVNQIHDATYLLRQYGIRPSFFIQFGYPGETKEDIRKTIRMINRLLPDSLGISVSYPLPGTPFYDRVKADLKDKSNWTDSDELRIMFRNTYHPAFYKQLHRYVHQSYRWHLALQQIKKLISRPAAVTGQSIKQAASIAWYAPMSLLGKLKLNKLEKLRIG
ncbi:radical SAM protein [Flavitalea sp. BT771]|uniref:B12-binding domain-containing radical SAM protein n=1 Tax=Flavitalea sp. BT771 TaxID=3063329 RepID=UPI0026E2314B|nr:radical SAM protein [Flavitalea sp. BT771]MDO6430687.1 radical SAM protein [Flavitalea sp. BT771]MDV6219173.1 radical SAM protein [Flavitalea sp. BT771]